MSQWDDWYTEKMAQIKRVEDEQRKKRKHLKMPPARRPITDIERKKIEHLNRCTFLPGSWDKRFARGLDGAEEITERQAVCLDKMVHRYRKQIGADLSEGLIDIPPE